MINIKTKNYIYIYIIMFVIIFDKREEAIFKKSCIWLYNNSFWHFLKINSVRNLFWVMLSDGFRLFFFLDF